MKSLIAVLAAFALLAPAASATGRGGGFAAPLAQREALTHGIAGDEEHVFVTEPGIGVSTAGPRVVVLDRRSGREQAVLPPPPGGFKLPFTLRVARTGHLVVLDSGGFPPQGPPVVYDYAYSDRHGFKAVLERRVDFAGLPLGFAEDVEVLPNGEYVVSESVFGGLWLIGRDGRIRPGLVPSDPTRPLPNIGPCSFPGDGTGMVGDLPFAAGGNFAPGAGSLAVHDDDLYAGDPFRLQLIRIDSRTGRREVLSTDQRLFDFTTATAFLPPEHPWLRNPLVTASDQEYRWATLNVALTADQFRPPFTVAQFWPR